MKLPLTTAKITVRTSIWPIQRRRFASQTKPLQACHPERSEGSVSGERSFAALRMTKPDGLFFAMYWALCPREGECLLQNIWYDSVRQYTRRLVGIRSVSPGEGEILVAEEVLGLLQAGGLESAYTASGLDPLIGDPSGRQNAYAFLRGRSSRAIVLFGHIDTVDTVDYGPLEPWANDPKGLAARLDILVKLAPSLAEDLTAHPSDWMFGRGVADMKSGVAATIAVMRHLAQIAREGNLPLSVVLLATPDEENESAGILQPVHFLLHLR